MAGLSASIRILLGKIESAVNSDFAAQHKKSALLLDMLPPMLSSILPLVPDLEEKQLRDQSMKVWIQKLADVVYDADDLVDEILYDDARIKVEAKSKKAASFARKLFFSIGKRYGKELKSNIKRILELTDYLLNVKNNFNLLPQRKYEESQIVSRSTTTTTSLVDKAEVVGRDEDMQKIVNLLVTVDAYLDVIAIVGMVGVGKTTLAQLVYNSTKVNRYFDLKIWIYVSEDFDVLNITRQILESTTAHVAESHNLTLDLLQTRLRESLKGKRFLLVLDDVWNDNFQDWEALKAPLIYGAKGSRILITTRINSVAGVMRSSNRYYLGLLPNEECWDIFHRIALAEPDMSQNVQLELIGKELVKRCNGLPLAVRAMGGLLRTKRTPEVWHRVLKSDIFQTVEDSMVLPVLHMSYFHLPDYLKPCFAYCSLFPSDFEFEAEKLMLLWIAEGFVVQSGNLSLEDVGAEYFNGLLERSFFQSTGGSYFKMHDLIHDLASYVAGEGFPGRHNKRTRHLSLSTGQYVSEKLQGIHEAKSLRTFLNHGSCQLSPGALEDMLARQRRLRVLSLPQFQNAQLPHSIGKLKHLRQLDLTRSALICLPESLCTLYYLQTLVLTNCVKLVLLPEGIVVLINLRHLFINGAGLQQMPKEIGRMKQLQTLTNFIVGYELNIKELGALIDLHGSLFVSSLQNVSSASDASEANLKDKRHLNELQLEWSSNQRDPAKHMMILENLEPSKALRKLTIQFYGGTVFPFWLGDSSFSNIVFLCLRDCNNCCSVPPLGELPSLEDLIIERIVAVTSIGHEFYKRNGSVARSYQSLKTLTFEGMTEWEQWISLDDGEFPHLQKLHLTNCPKLEWGLPKSLPSLVELRISDCQQLSALLPRTPDNCKVELHNSEKLQQRNNDDNLSNFTDGAEAYRFPSSVGEISGYQPDGFSSSIPTNKVLQDDSLSSSSSSVTFKVSSITKLMDLPPQLRSLKIERCNTLESLPRGILDRPLLQRLYMIDLESLKTFPQLDQPSSLKKLYISNCRNFEFPQHNEMANQFIQLEHLCLGNSCDSLVSFPLNAFPKLTTLTLWGCENLESLSMAKGLQNDMKSLEVLEIRDCTKFTTFPTEGLQAPHLTSLVLSNCNNLKSLPRWMQSLISLQSLHINKCSKLEPLPPWQLPSSLNILCISLCDKITPQTTWELSNLPSLGHFEIEGGCQDVFSFPEDGLLPNNLKSLRISSLLNLKSLDIDGIQQLTSLQSLEIIDCKELRSLPEDGLPSSLQHLCIMGCSLLNPKLQKRKGKEWFKISHIPSIQLGDPEVVDYGRDDLKIRKTRP